MKHQGKTISKIFKSDSLVSLSKLLPSLSGILAAGEDNEEILQIAKDTLKKHWNSLLADPDVGSYITGSVGDGVDVVKASVSEIKITSGCISLQLLVYGVPKGNDYALDEDVSPNGAVVSGITTETLARFTVDFLEDVINKITVSYVSYTMMLQAGSSGEGKIEMPLIPTGRITTFASVPTTLVTTQKYGKIPEGTKMYLDFDSMLYRDQDMAHPGGIPADIVVNLWNHACGSPCPTSELFEVDDLCVSRDEQDLDDTDEDDEEDGLERDLRNLTAFQVAEEGGEENEDLPSSFWENLGEEEEN